MTNLEKLKAEIAEMSAEEFRDLFRDASLKYGFDCMSRAKVLPGCCMFRDCRECEIKWLNEESEETNET